MATPEEVRTWAAEIRAWAGINRDPETAASMRQLADKLDELARWKEHNSEQKAAPPLNPSATP
jgi:hypothetical protein